MRERAGILTRRSISVAVGVVLLVAAACLTWVTLRGLSAYGDLRSGRSALRSTSQAMQKGDVGAARTQVRLAQRDFSSARDKTHDLVWQLVAGIPWVGDSVAGVMETVDVVHDVADHGLPPLIETATLLDPDRIRDGRRIDLGRIRAARSPATKAAQVTADADRRMSDIDGHLFGPVEQQVGAVQVQVADLAGAADAVSRATQLLPSMLGGDGARRYLLVVENPAEARGTGGLLGAYGVLTARRGEISLGRTGPNQDLEDAARLPVELGPQFRRLWGNDPAIWRNSNVSPHFPYAAQIWLALWQRQHGERLDGVLSVDPVVMGYLLDAVGPVRLFDGTRVTGKTAASTVMRDAYARYPRAAEKTERDAYLIMLGERVIDRLLSGAGSSRSLFYALRRGVTEGRLELYSAHSRESSLLASTRISGQVPTTAAPYLSVVVNNGGGDKLDFYLDRRVTYRQGPCGPDGRNSQVVIEFANRAPRSGLPAYVLGRGIRASDGTRLPTGTSRLLVYVYATPEARLFAATADGRELALQRFAERGHPVYAFTIDLRPGEERTVELGLVEPSQGVAPTVDVQPLARPQVTQVVSGTC